MMARPTIDTRFFSKVYFTSTCWVWTGAIAGDLASWRRGLGYGIFWDGTRHVRAHRLAHERMVGPIPKGLVIDHLCSNRRCVRPDHLEAVTPLVNVHRSRSPSAENALKTHCPKGHAYEGTNIRFHKKKNGSVSRECAMCIQEKNHRQHLRRKAAEPTPVQPLSVSRDSMKQLGEATDKAVAASKKK